MEEHDCIAALLSAVIPDLRRQPLGYSAPAGQGSRLLRLGAVAAGLGTLGLNRMLLTPQFGPRLFLTGIITDLSLAFDSPLDDELCPGLEGCGRCAAVCPAAAIPLEAPLGAALSEVRDLDLEACVEESQPYGPLRMVRHFEEIFASPSGEAAGEVIRRPETQQLFFNLTVLRQGSFTGCARCELVCPLGEDYAEIESSASRRGDLPEDLAPVVDGEVVRVSAYGRHRTG
jgi:epoxyqueuosine reductase